MKQHTKRITAAVTPEIAAIYEKLAIAGERTLSSIVSDVLVSRARECLYFLRWLERQPPASAERSQATAAVGYIARASLIDTVRALDPTYRTPSERVLDRQAVAEAALSLLEELEKAANLDESSSTVLETARENAAVRGARRWRDGGTFITRAAELEEPSP